MQRRREQWNTLRRTRWYKELGRKTIRLSVEQQDDFTHVFHTKSALVKYLNVQFNKIARHSLVSYNRINGSNCLMPAIVMDILFLGVYVVNFP